MLFSEVLASATREGDVWTTHVPADWMQGRSVFGGLQVALAAQAMRALVPGIPLRSMQTTFVAPVAGTVKVRARVLRRGKSAVQVEARIFEGEETLCLVVGVFGSGRPSRIAVDLKQQPAIESPSAVDLDSARGTIPVFARHFSMRWLEGGPPLAGVTSTKAVIEVGLKDTAKTSELHVIAIADAIPPVALSLLTTDAMASSVTWTLDFLRDDVSDLALAGWRVDAELSAGHDGYTTQSTMIWGPGGVPVVLTRQCMVVFG